MLTVGSLAPDFTLLDQNGDSHSLSDYRGKKVVLYFYPKDNTPGCTAQAKGFSLRKDSFSESNTVVLGISKDSVRSHKNFETKQELNFTLLSDPELTVIKLYDVYGEKKLYGKVSMGVIRSTYLIDEEGRILQALKGVKAADNPQQMLELLSSADPA